MIRLPPEITLDERPLPEGGWSYDFRHRSLSALGRILLQDLPGGRGTHVSCEVAGDPADPRTVERRRLFEPLGIETSRQLERATGPYYANGVLAKYARLVADASRGAVTDLPGPEA